MDIESCNQYQRLKFKPDGKKCIECQYAKDFTCEFKTWHRIEENVASNLRKELGFDIPKATKSVDDLRRLISNQIYNWQKSKDFKKIHSWDKLNIWKRLHEDTKTYFKSYHDNIFDMFSSIKDPEICKNDEEVQLSWLEDAFSDVDYFWEEYSQLDPTATFKAKLDVFNYCGHLIVKRVRRVFRDYKKRKEDLLDASLDNRTKTIKTRKIIPASMLKDLEVKVMYEDQTIKNLEKILKILHHKNEQYELFDTRELKERKHLAYIEDRDKDGNWKDYLPVILKPIDYKQLSVLMNVTERTLRDYIREMIRVGFLIDTGKRFDKCNHILVIGRWIEGGKHEHREYLLKDTPEMREAIKQFNPYRRQKEYQKYLLDCRDKYISMTTHRNDISSEGDYTP